MDWQSQKHGELTVETSKSSPSNSESVFYHNKEALLHYIMSVTGGIFAIYSLLEHSNVFGSAETSNMILLVNDFLHWDTFHILIRMSSLFVYATGIILAVWMAEKYPSLQKMVCIIIDFIAALILGLMPEGIHPVVALYPVAFAMSIQWCSFRGIDKNPSATTFSTGNFRQLVTIIFKYITERKREDLSHIRFYILTILSFHSGIATIYIFHDVIPHQSIWLSFIPLTAALTLEIVVEHCNIKSYELLFWKKHELDKEGIT